MRKGLLTVTGLSLLLILGTSGIKKVDSANGITGRTTSGCGSCHGSTTGTITLNGIGANIKAGGVYPFTLVYNPAASYKYWGLDIKVSTGTLTAGTGMKLSGSEVTHSSPLGGTAATSYTYTGMKWTAPATIAVGTKVTFNYACVAGSSTGTTSGPCQVGSFSTTAALISTPVEFASFNAAWAGDNKVNLVWKTATETNTDYFEVERSFNGETYAPVSRIKAAGTSDYTRTYTANDVVVGSSVAYYRIKEVDLGGNATYSDVKVANIKPVKNFVKGIYPNPVMAGQSINIQYVALENGKVSVELYNCLGKKMNTLTIDAVTGENQIKFNTGRFVSPGIYYVVVNNGTEKIAQLPVSVQ